MYDVQTRLNILRFDAGRPDGLAGRQTRSAIRQFQAFNQLPVTGKLTNAGLVALYQQSNAVLSQNTAPQQPATIAPTTQPATNVTAAPALVVAPAVEAEVPQQPSLAAPSSTADTTAITEDTVSSFFEADTSNTTN